MKSVIVFLAAALVAAGQTRGLRPRASATDYPAYAAQNGVQVAAEPLDPEHARKAFATDLADGYIVVEVGVFPNNVPVKLRNIDFELRLNGHPTPVRPVSAEAIASNLTRPAGRGSGPNAPGNITVYPSADVGYESGGYGVDGRRHSGVIVGTGVGVGIGGGGRDVPPPAASGKNRTTMETELTEKGLPEGQISGPVAGYLYFPIPSTRKKYTVASLEYLGDNATVNVVFPPSRKR